MIGSQDRHIAQFAHFPCQGKQAGGSDAVIVGYKNMSHKAVGWVVIGLWGNYTRLLPSNSVGQENGTIPWL